MDPSQSIPRLINYYINCIREEGKRIYSYRGHQDSSFITLDQELLSREKPYVNVSRSKSLIFKSTANRSFSMVTLCI